MKQHLIVKGRGPLRDRAPSWVRFIRDKSGAVTTLHPAFDRLARAHGVAFYVTQEYTPKHGSWTHEEIAAGLNRLYRVILQRDVDLPRELIERARLISDFEYVRSLEVAPSALPRQLDEPQREAPLDDNSRELIGLRAAHLLGSGHPDVKVAVIDTGISLRHPELRGRVAGAADFVDLDGLDTSGFIGDTMEFDAVPEDEVGHGSHVAGIIAGAGVKVPPGVAPKCRILAVRALATMKDGDRLVGAGIPDNINAAIKWAVDQGAHVINMSLGIKRSGGGLPHEEVIRYANARGVTVVAASGNDGTEEKYYPGALKGVIAVGATDRARRVAEFTSFGAPVWMLAPGTGIDSSYARERYARASGTSQASPFVAGAAALLRSNALDAGAILTDADVKAIFRHTSDKPDRQTRTGKTGYGCLNVLDACRLLHHWLHDGTIKTRSDSAPARNARTFINQTGNAP